MEKENIFLRVETLVATPFSGRILKPF
jgi:hypothetical protein